MLEKKEIGESSALSDEEIVALYWERDEQAIAETDRKYRWYLYSLAYNVLHDNMDCEECLNDTYLGTWNKIPPSRPKWFGAFVARIMRNQALKKYRDERAQKRIPSEMILAMDELNECIAYTPSEEEQYHVHEMGKVLNTYLHTLDDRQVYVFVCRYVCSDSVEKIASMLGVSRSTIFRDLTDIRNGLKKKLEEAGYHDA